MFQEAVIRKAHVNKNIKQCYYYFLKQNNYALKKAMLCFRQLQLNINFL